MELGINHIFSLIAVFQSFFLAFFIVSKKKNWNANNYLLATILILFSILILNTFANSREVMPHLRFWKLVVMFSNTPLIISPLLFIYAQSLSKSNFKFSKIQLLHFLPALVLTLFFIYYWYPNPKIGIIKMQKLYIFVQSGILLQNIIYLIAIVIQLKGILKLQRTRLSDNSNSKTSLFIQMIIAFGLFWLIETNCMVVYWIFKKHNFCPYSHTLYYTSGFIMFNLLLYFSLSNPDMFSIKKKYQSSKLDEGKKEFYAKRLREIMDNERPYFDSELNLSKLAIMLDISARDLSQVINECFNMSFIDFINKYRIDECKKHLLNFENNNHKYIADIYYSVGFNSKSVFNSAFKKSTGLTPSQYILVNANVN